jgi:hypothetical protein
MKNKIESLITNINKLQFDYLPHTNNYLNLVEYLINTGRIDIMELKELVTSSIKEEESLKAWE